MCDDLESKNLFLSLGHQQQDNKYSNHLATNTGFILCNSDVHFDFFQQLTMRITTLSAIVSIRITWMIVGINSLSADWRTRKKHAGKGPFTPPIYYMYVTATAIVIRFKNGLCTHFYRPQRSCGKVMFLHLSVSHSVHRGLSGRPPGQTPLGRPPP